jgi:hypothetical protein
MTTAEKIQAAVAFDIAQGLKYADNSMACDADGNCMLQDSLAYCNSECRVLSRAIEIKLKVKAAAGILKKEDLELNNVDAVVKEDL